MRRNSVFALAALLLVCVAVLFWMRSNGGVVAGRPGVAIEGVDEALPRADPVVESVLPEALDAARVEIQRRDGRALVVHRHGHRLFEYFRDEADRSAFMDGGGLAAVVLALTLQKPEELSTDDAHFAATLVRDRIWLPLRAGAASLSLRAAAGLPDCCIEARADDWMRVADLLVGTGTYHGERVLPADAIRSLLAGSRSPPWQGGEPLLARDGPWFDLGDGVRVWLAPQRQITILIWGDDTLAHDTLIPNIVLRGLTDAAPATSGDMNHPGAGHLGANEERHDL